MKIKQLEDKMVEITSEEQNKVKRMKGTEDTLRVQGSQKKKRKRKGIENF